ncbi:MAG: DUF4359 domain-containing protein, partial [Jaaginema sp. PMC 1079.18]|nr:DUF4359 domain-containing protein [Jaaginema sp. PMC 1079.18]
MKNLPITLGIASFIIFVLGSMIIANPTNDDYQDFAARRLAEYLKENTCQQLPQDFGALILQHCQTVAKTMIDIGRPQLKEFIGTTTQKHNFLFFTIYETTIKLDKSMPTYEFETLGILQNFYLYSIEE